MDPAARRTRPTPGDRAATHAPGAGPPDLGQFPRILANADSSFLCVTKDELSVTWGGSGSPARRAGSRGPSGGHGAAAGTGPGLPRADTDARPAPAPLLPRVRADGRLHGVSSCSAKGFMADHPRVPARQP